MFVVHFRLGLQVWWYFMQKKFTFFNFIISLLFCIRSFSIFLLWFVVMYHFVQGLLGFHFACASFTSFLWFSQLSEQQNLKGCSFFIICLLFPIPSWEAFGWYFTFSVLKQGKRFDLFYFLMTLSFSIRSFSIFPGFRV